MQAFRTIDGEAFSCSSLGLSPKSIHISYARDCYAQTLGMDYKTMEEDYDASCFGYSTSAFTSRSTSASTTGTSIIGRTIAVRFDVPKQDCEKLLSNEVSKRYLFQSLAKRVANMRLSLGGTGDWEPIYETIKDSNVRCGSLFVDLDVRQYSRRRSNGKAYQRRDIVRDARRESLRGMHVW